MKRMMFVLMALAALLTACAGAAIDTSKSYSRGVINRGAIVEADSVRLHEYLNYYDQSLPAPRDTSLALDVRLGSPTVAPAGGTAWLQIGMQAREAEGAARTPLNLALVLDVSGSMSAPDKMPYLKRSLRLFLESLYPDDRVAIVAYSSRAHLIHRSSPVGDGGWIQVTVDRLHPGGNTNLHAGLMMGFEQVDRHFDRRRNNRVILLTDGIANRGVVHPERIAAEAADYNERGIQLSTVGLGMDLNDELLSTLAHQGHGVYHFIDSADEMDRVFRQEVSGLVERVAREVVVTFQPGAGVELVEIVGAQWQPAAGGASVRLQDMGAGDSQVLLARLRYGPGERRHRTLGEVQLRYQDAFAERERSEKRIVTAEVEERASHLPLQDPQVRRNVTIVRSARALIEIDGLFRSARYERAWQLAAEMERELRSLAIQLEDPQLAEDADLFARYQVTLAAAMGYEPEHPSEPLVEYPTRAPLDPVLPTVEVR